MSPQRLPGYDASHYANGQRLRGQPLHYYLTARDLLLSSFDPLHWLKPFTALKAHVHIVRSAARGGKKRGLRFSPFSSGQGVVAPRARCILVLYICVVYLYCVFVVQTHGHILYIGSPLAWGTWFRQKKFDQLAAALFDLRGELQGHRTT